MPDDVEVDDTFLDVVTDAVITDPVSPLADFNTFQLLTLVWRRLNPFQGSKDLTLDFLGQVSKIVLELFGGNKFVVGH